MKFKLLLVFVCLIFLSCGMSKKKRIESLQAQIEQLKKNKLDFTVTAYLAGDKKTRYDADYSADSISQIIEKLENEMNRILAEPRGIRISIDY